MRKLILAFIAIGVLFSNFAYAEEKPRRIFVMYHLFIERINDKTALVEILSPASFYSSLDECMKDVRYAASIVPQVRPKCAMLEEPDPDRAVLENKETMLRRRKEVRDFVTGYMDYKEAIDKIEEKEADKVFDEILNEQKK
jgi:hypothetical protein